MGRTHDVTISAFDLDRLEGELEGTKEELADAKAAADFWMRKATEADKAADDLKAEVEDWKKEYTTERALADRLHGALDALDYNLAFAGNTLIGGLRERVTAMRAIALPAIEAWKEARSE